MAPGVAAALSDYVADRCNLPAGALTAAEVVSRLRDGAVADPLVEAVASVLAECEAQRYAGGAAATTDVLERATRCIDDLERERLG
jgi:hypothetical protein